MKILKLNEEITLPSDEIMAMPGNEVQNIMLYLHQEASRRGIRVNDNLNACLRYTAESISDLGQWSSLNNAALAVLEMLFDRGYTNAKPADFIDFTEVYDKYQGELKSVGGLQGEWIAKANLDSLMPDCGRKLGCIISCFQNGDKLNPSFYEESGLSDSTRNGSSKGVASIWKALTKEGSPNVLAYAKWKKEQEAAPNELDDQNKNIVNKNTVNTLSQPAFSYVNAGVYNYLSYDEMFKVLTAMDGLIKTADDIKTSGASSAPRRRSGRESFDREKFLRDLAGKFHISSSDYDDFAKLMGEYDRQFNYR